jgi:hypothetical protein
LRAQQDAAAANQLLAKLQQQVAEAMAAKEAAEKQAADQAQQQQLDLTNPVAPVLPPHLVTFECRFEDLPAMIPEPAPDQWPDYYNLWMALETLEQQESAAGIKVPVSFAQLQVGIQTPRQLLGETIWKLAFLVQPEPGSAVTVQIRQLLAISMRKHQSKLLADQGKQQEAMVRVGPSIDQAVTEFRAKRKRTEQ